AASSYSESLKIYTEIENRKGRADALLGLAHVHRARERYTKATSPYSESLEIYTEIADSKGREDALLGLVEVYRAQGSKRKLAETLLALGDVGLQVVPSSDDDADASA
ncbi:hypothetical protein FS837_008629, partial [Tulasnella sp. UAMH 9824]